MLAVPITSTKAVRVQEEDGPLQGSVGKETSQIGPPMLELQLGSSCER